MIRHGLGRLNHQLEKMVELMPDCDEWEGESVGTDVERRRSRKKEQTRRENGECRDSLCISSDIG